jgi:hypothetical protein
MMKHRNTHKHPRQFFARVVSAIPILFRGSNPCDTSFTAFVNALGARTVRSESRLSSLSLSPSLSLSFIPIGVIFAHLGSSISAKDSERLRTRCVNPNSTHNIIMSHLVRSSVGRTLTQGCASPGPPRPDFSLPLPFPLPISPHACEVADGRSSQRGVAVAMTAVT